MPNKACKLRLKEENVSNWSRAKLLRQTNFVVTKVKGI